MKKTSKIPESSNQLAFYLTGLAGAAALTGTSQGATVSFADSGSFYQGLSTTPDVPTVNISLPDTSVLNLDPGDSGNYLELIFNSDWHSTGRFTGSSTFQNGYPGVSLLQFGDAISANNSGSYAGVASLVNDGTVQLGFTGNVSGYVGFVTPLGNKGWLAVTYNSTSGLFTWNGGAVETSGGDLTAGATAIPEASSAALLALGAVGMLRRRRKAA